MTKFKLKRKVRDSLNNIDLREIKNISYNYNMDGRYMRPVLHINCEESIIHYGVNQESPAFVLALIDKFNNDPKYNYHKEMNINE